MTHDRSDQAIAERAIVFQVLRDDHPERWSRAELERAITTITPLAISDALEQLHAEGVVDLDGEQVKASGCARYLDALELICI
jgi:DNA-binding HxlR family transcriptional regulator